MTGSKKDLPPPTTAGVLSRRFSNVIDDPPPATTPQSPHTRVMYQPPHTPQTSHTARESRGGSDGRERRNEPAGMTRRTYYYSAAVADALAAAVDRLHYGSHGRIAKHAALDAIIRSGVEQVDAIERDLRGET